MAIKAVWKTNFLPVLKINVTIDIETLAWGLQDILNETNSSIRWKKKKKSKYGQNCRSQQTRSWQICLQWLIFVLIRESCKNIPVILNNILVGIVRETLTIWFVTQHSICRHISMYLFLYLLITFFFLQYMCYSRVMK